MSPIRSFVFFLLSIITVPFATAQTAGTIDHQTQAQRDALTNDLKKSAAARSYGNLALYFEENTGQSAPGVQFVSHGPGYTLFLSPSESVLALHSPVRDNKRERLQERQVIRKTDRHERAVNILRMKLLGTNQNAEVTGLKQLPGVVNYLLGKNPEKWHKGIRTYSTVQYANIYPNVDLVYYGNQRQLEYDFILKSGADPKQISLGFEGAQKSSITASGDIAITTPAGTLTMKKPGIYQMENGARKKIAGNYELRTDHNIGIRVKAYDPTRPLVIDPVLVYSTFLGGSDNDADGIAVDALGESFLVGSTDYDDYPTTQSPLGSGPANGPVAFVTKLNSTGTALVYSTYLGGTSDNYGYGIGLDSNGSSYVTGLTSSFDFPVTGSAYQSNLSAGALNVFFSKLSSDGQSLLYSTFLGGSGQDYGYALVVDGNQNAYIAGQTTSADFPITTGAVQNTLRSLSGGNAFLSRIDTTQSGANSLVYSTFLGGSSAAGDGAVGVAVDAHQNAYIAGGTCSTDFPVTQQNAFQTTGSANCNAFLARIDTTQTGSAGLLYSTYLGGTSFPSGSGFGDGATAVTLDPASKVYIAGGAVSADFPTTNSGTNSALGKAFVAKFDTTLTSYASLLYSVLVGGSGGDQAYVLSVDPGGNAYFAGATWSSDFPVTPDAVQSSFLGSSANSDGFLTVLSGDASQMLYSTYLGGSGNQEGGDAVLAIALDAGANIYLAGGTDSSDFPVTPSAWQTSYQGGPYGGEGFVTELSALPTSTPTITSLLPNIGSAGTPITIYGSGFGATRGTSSALLGTTTGLVVSWSDTQVVATVAPSSQSGTVQILQLGALSNALAFTVTTPTISSLTPASGAAGTQVTFTGSGFGNSQGSSTVWLGSTLGSVVSWSSTQVVATVTTGSTSGSAQIQQGGVSSNAIPFTVNSPTISSASPTSGLAGTQVTLTGSGFGATQGAGIVWLGNTAGVVSSWSDGQVVATVALGASSGTAKILQNGVWSNSVPFAVSGGAPHITSITPNTGGAGTAVAILGTGFGSSQGNGVVSIGGTTASVNSWGETQVSATVGSSAISGVVKIQQNALWSNAATFTVPVGSGATQLTLNPNVITMLVGDTRSIQALGSNTQPVSGLTWTSSDITVVTLSTDDPPILTAVAPGNATITAGSASADITVYAGFALPLGTVIWSAPGDSSGVQGIVPAVPSYAGVADVFGLQTDCNVQAMTSDGTVAWTVNIGQRVDGNGCRNLIADFQGGFIAQDPGVPNMNTPGSVQKFDGMTGQPLSAYSISNPHRRPSNAPGPSAVVHPDGTIFAVDGDSLVAIDPATGLAKFKVRMDHSTFACTPEVSDALPQILTNPIIAGDGNAYVLYDYNTSSVQGPCPGFDSHFSHYEVHARLLRVSTDGSSSKIVIADSTEDIIYTQLDNNGSYQVSKTGANPFYDEFQAIITNQDQGVLIAWYAPMPGYCEVSTVIVDPAGGPSSGSNSGCVLGSANYVMIATSGTSVSSRVTVPDQINYINPILQAQDGTYFGVIDYVYSGDDFLAKFDQFGNIQWSVPNYYAQMATADGGLIAQSADGSSTVTFDANGNATGQLPNLPQYPSWLGNGYNYGSVEQVTSSLVPLAGTFAALFGGNASGNGTAIQQVQTNQPQGLAKQLPSLLQPVSCLQTPGSGSVIPTCGNVNAIELLTNQSTDSIFQRFIQTFAPVADVVDAQGKKPNPVMYFDNANAPNGLINVSAPGQVLKISLRSLNSYFQDPFFVMTERVDPVNHIISVVTLQGHPLAGWRYWRVYSIGTTPTGQNDVVIETGAYDEPGPGPKNYTGYYLARGDISSGWAEYARFFQTALPAPQGSNLHNTLGGTQIINYFPNQWEPPTLVDGYWDYGGFLTNYILNNVCQSTSCN